VTTSVKPNQQPIVKPNQQPAAKPTQQPNNSPTQKPDSGKKPQIESIDLDGVDKKDPDKKGGEDSSTYFT